MAAVTVLGLAGCGSSATGAAAPLPTATAGPAAPPLCGLLTAAQVQQVLGGAAGAGSPSAVISSANCVWRRSADPAISVVLVQTDAAQFTSSLTASSGPLLQRQPITGVGDQAFYFTSEGDTILLVRGGNFYFSVGVNRDNGPDPSAERQAALFVLRNYTTEV